jgi:hypothetical protein
MVENVEGFKPHFKRALVKKGEGLQQGHVVTEMNEVSIKRLDRQRVADVHLGCRRSDGQQLV